MGYRPETVKDMIRPQILPESVNDAVAMLNINISLRAQQHGDGAYVNVHEALGIIAEEYKELIDAVQSNKLMDVRSELIDIAVAIIWAVAGINQGVYGQRPVTTVLT